MHKPSRIGKPFWDDPDCPDMVLAYRDDAKALLAENAKLTEARDLLASALDALSNTRDLGPCGLGPICQIQDFLGPKPQEPV